MAALAAMMPLLLLLQLQLLLPLAAGAAVAEKKQQQIEPRPVVAFTPGFPEPELRQYLGQVAGVAIDSHGQSFLFHRGRRTWGEGDFDENNKYTRVKQGPISDPAIIQVDGNGKAVAAYGEDFFYLPHGITVDKNNQLWTTDVARHQVIRINLNNRKVDEVVGEAFTPGSDSGHLCKPTQVAVASNGDFFVADGYCNHRVMKFSKDGKFLGQFGRKPEAGGSLDPDQLLVPHGLALLERMDLLCVADRENKRVQCFNAGIKKADGFGKFVKSVDSRLGRVYDIDFLPSGELLILHILDDRKFSLVNIHNLVTDSTVGQFSYVPDQADGDDNTAGLGAAHSIASAPNGKFALVGSLTATCDTRQELCEMGLAAPYQVFRFSIQQELPASVRM